MQTFYQPRLKGMCLQLRVIARLQYRGSGPALGYANGEQEPSRDQELKRDRLKKVLHVACHHQHRIKVMGCGVDKVLQRCGSDLVKHMREGLGRLLTRLRTKPRVHGSRAQSYR
jgi:hypothetical protein